MESSFGSRCCPDAFFLLPGPFPDCLCVLYQDKGCPEFLAKRAARSGIFQAFFYLTPILYPLEVLPASFQKVFLLNPFYYFIQSFRFPIYSAQFPPGRIFWVALGLTVIVFFTGLGIFYKREKYFVFNLS